MAAVILFSSAVLIAKECRADWSAWETPVVYYDFEGTQASANVKDRAGSNDATLVIGAPAVEDGATGIAILGKRGRRAVFNGTTDYGSAADSTQFSQTTSFSVEAWVKFGAISTTDTTIQTVVAKWDETSDQRSYRLIIQTDATGRAWPKFQVSPDGTSGSIKTATGKTQMVANQWYLLQGYYNATAPGTSYLYVNGVREGSASTVGTSISDTTSKFFLGATKTGASTYTNYLNGSLDEVRILSGARDDGSLAYSMERGKPSADIAFDEGAGFSAVDQSPQKNRGALVNFPTNNSQWVQGHKNYGLQFDGTDDYVDIGNKATLQLGGAVTLEAWIYVAGLGNYTIVSQPNTNGYTFLLTSGGELTFGALGGATVTSSGAAITAGAWTHVAVAYNGVNASFYKDGRLISSPALALWAVTDGSVFIGKAGSTPNYFAGKMDDVLIYPYDRTLFEIYSDLAGGMVQMGQAQALEPHNSQMSCPQGFVGVPGDPLYGTSDFCVMKYEAKCDVDSDGTGETASGSHAACNTTYDTWGNILAGCKCITDKGGQIVSSAAGDAIARIAQNDATTDDAESYCTSRGWHLITNNEWMTIARNAERLGSNWCDSNGSNCGFSPGTASKILAAGHNDNSPAADLQASTDDSQACYGTVTKNTNNACGSVGGTQKRTHKISNGETIWDLAGGVWEWTNDTITAQNQPEATDGATTRTGFNWSGFTNDGVTWYLSNHGTLGYDAIRPSNATWNANQGVGRIYHDSNSAGGTVYAFLRGASWSYGSYAGVFTLILYLTPGYTGDNNVGFRCAVAP